MTDTIILVPVLVLPSGRYGLWQVQTDFVRREATIRFAPLVDVHPDVTGAIEHEVVRNESEPCKPWDLPPKPEAPGADAADEEHEKHAAAMQEWLGLRRRHADAVAKYEAAVRQGKGWDEWMADGRPDHVKAIEHFKKRRGL